jgi:hypothetical protein
MTNLSPAERYVKARRDLDLMYSKLTAEERAKAAEGLAWLERMGSIYVGPKKRGRPPGSKNRKPDTHELFERQVIAIVDSQAGSAPVPPATVEAAALATALEEFQGV